MRVLLVEDEAPLRETLAARLKREGFAVDTAGDGPNPARLRSRPGLPYARTSWRMNKM